MKIFIVLALICLIPLVSAGHFFVSTGPSDKGGVSYGSCIVGSHLDYILDDKSNQTAIAFSTKENKLGSCLYCGSHLTKSSNLTYVKQYINQLYNLSPEYLNYPDLRENISQNVFEYLQSKNDNEFSISSSSHN